MMDQGRTLALEQRKMADTAEAYAKRLRKSADILDPPTTAATTATAPSVTAVRKAKAKVEKTTGKRTRKGKGTHVSPERVNQILMYLRVNKAAKVLPSDIAKDLNIAPSSVYAAMQVLVARGDVDVSPGSTPNRKLYQYRAQ